MIGYAARIGYATLIGYAVPIIFAAPFHHATAIADTPTIAMQSPIPVDSDYQALYDTATQVPNDVLALLPPPTDSIIQFLAWNLPDVISSPAITLPEVESSITTECACWTLESLEVSPIPPRKWIGDLEQQLMKRFKTGDIPVSIQHPRTSDLCLPLWGISFWRSALDVRREKDRWDEAQRWIASEASQGMETSPVGELMGRTPWGMMVRTSPEVDSPIGFMSVFLSTRWLAERHLDIFASYYSEHTRGHADEWWVGGTYLSVLIRGLSNMPDRLPKSGGDLDQLGKAFADGKYRQLIFPANLNNNHWIAVHVDIVKKEFRYGMTPLPLELLQTLIMHHTGDSAIGTDTGPGSDLYALRGAIASWLKVVFGEAFRDKGASLPIGRQRDGYSCGPCVLNAIEHAILDAPLIKHKDRHGLRAAYFVELMGYILRDVSVLSLDSRQSSLPHTLPCSLHSSHQCRQYRCR